MIWLVATLFGLTFAALAFVIGHALSAGADAYSGKYSERTARQFEDVFLFVPPRRVAEAGMALGGCAFVLIFLAAGDFESVRGILTGLVLASLGAVAAMLAPRGALAWLRNRRLKRFNLQLVDTLVSMSNGLKAGFSITQVFESVVQTGENPIAQEFGVFLHQTRVGIGFSEALTNMEERVGSDDLALLIAAIETARKTGGNLTEILEQIAATIRERMRIENRIRTLTAQGRLQGIVVALMPVAIGLAMMVVDRPLMLSFMHSGVGMLAMAVAGALIGSGAMLVRKIVRIDV